jgi:hypothetical protein
LKTKLIFLIVILTVCYLPVLAQTTTNLEIIKNLVGESVAQADSILKVKAHISLSVETAQPLEVLKPIVYDAFNKKGYILKSDMAAATQVIDYSIISTKVDYKNSFSDGIFGGTMLVREIQLNGSLVIKGEDKTVRPLQFIQTHLDTIKLEDISIAENQTLPFTHAQLPSLPLLSNLWEPIIVVGTLTVTVILLFTVRSK